MIRVPLCEHCGRVIMPLLFAAPPPFSVMAEQIFMEQIARKIARCTAGCHVYASLVRNNTNVEHVADGWR